MKTVVTKGDFARLKSRSPACISKWILEKKISPEALIGEGRLARIWLERAEADLTRTLDPAQQAAQESPILGPVPGIVPTPGDVRAAVQAPALPRLTPVAGSTTDDEDLRRRRRADADKAEHDAEAARRKLAVDEGRWVDAGEAARLWGRELAKLTADTETFLFTTLAREIAQRHGLDWKALAVEIRELFHKHRSTASEDARMRREAIEREVAEAAG